MSQWRLRRPRAFGVVIGFVVGALCTGLAVPYVRSDTIATSALSSAAGGASGAGTPGATGGAGAATTGGAGGAAAGGGTAGGAAAGDGAGDPSAAGGGDSGALTASDVGVTPDSVKVGIGILDIGVAQELGFNFDIGAQQARYQALIDDQNAKGGINGRKIVPDFRTLDIGHAVESEQSACVGWTQDSKVFSVLVESQFVQAATVCVIGQGATPLFSTDGIDESYYANGLYFSMQASDNRIVRDHANYLHEKGVLQGKTIGILAGEGSERLAIDNTLVPTLNQLGYQVADIEVVPASTSGTQKLSIAVSNFKAAKVDFVIIEANVILAGPFVQSAHRAGYDPQYGLSDFNNEINDQVASYYPDSFEGTVGISTHRFPEYRAGMPIPPADQHCIDRTLPVDPKVMPATNSAHEVAMGECAMFDAWVAAATAAGPNLTRAGFVAAADTLGTFGIPATFDGSFGPNKHDAVDVEREVAWHKSCTCWEIVDPNATRRIQ